MDLALERTMLLERDAEWAAQASEGRDVEAILSYWTDDAVVLPPGLPAVTGKTALREYILASLQIPGFSITWTSSDVAFSPDGNLAYMFSENSVTMNGTDGKPSNYSWPSSHDLAQRAGWRMAVCGGHVERTCGLTYKVL